MPVAPVRGHGRPPPSASPLRLFAFAAAALLTYHLAATTLRNRLPPATKAAARPGVHQRARAVLRARRLVAGREEPLLAEEAHAAELEASRESARPLAERLRSKRGAVGVELWGGLVMDGTRNVQATAAACRETCEQHLRLNGAAGCTAWVFCGDRAKCGGNFGSCWLKSQDDPGKPEVREQGGHVPWTSGTLEPSATQGAVASGDVSGIDERFAQDPDYQPSGGPADALHFVITSNGSPYVNFQTRVMYHSYLAARAKATGDDAAFHGGFTRILHRRMNDALMREVPTVRVQPLHPACDTWCEFPVADRPDAFRQWLLSRDSRRFRYIMLGESDYVVVRPLPSIKVREALADHDGVCYHYDYINPRYGGVEQKLRDMVRIGGGYELPPIDRIYSSGPAPVILTREGWEKVTPPWQSFTKAIEDTPGIKSVLGWVREMYAWSAAAAVVGLNVLQQDRGSTFLIAQPPADDAIDDATMYHYTWGTELRDAGSNKVVWEWDKRKYTGASDSFKLPELAMPPTAGSYYQQFPTRRIASAELLSTLADLIGRFNDAARELPQLPSCGWELLPPCP